MKEVAVFQMEISSDTGGLCGSSDSIRNWQLTESMKDKLRRPRKDAPAADQELKNLLKYPAPPCPGEALRRATIAGIIAKLSCCSEKMALSSLFMKYF